MSTAPILTKYDFHLVSHFNGFPCASVFSRCYCLNTKAAMDSLQCTLMLYFSFTVFYKHQTKHSLMDNCNELSFRTQPECQSSPAFAFCPRLMGVSFRGVSCEFVYIFKAHGKNAQHTELLLLKILPSFPVALCKTVSVLLCEVE